MAQVSGGSSGTDDESLKITVQPLRTALVINDVEIQTKIVEVQVPKFTTVDQIKLVDKEETQIKYVNVEKETVHYNTQEELTTKYITKSEDTTKYIVKEKDTIKYNVVEEPIVVYVPKQVEKEYTLYTCKDVKSLENAITLIPKLIKIVEDLTTKLEGMREYKLVEEVIKVPHVQYVPVEVERVVWKDTVKERG